jgi:hypothetical protein
LSRRVTSPPTRTLATIRDGPNRTYYLKKRAQGHKHIPAVIALARRRVDVLWALLRDNRPFSASPPTTSAAA